MVNKFRGGDGHGWTWCNARTGPPSLALGKLFLLCFFLRVVSNNVIKVRGGVKGSVKSVATRSCTYLECLTSLLMAVSVGVQKELV